MDSDLKHVKLFDKVEKWSFASCFTLWYSVILQVDHWLEFSVNNSLDNPNEVNMALQCLNKSLAPVAFLVGHSVTLADFAVWGALKGL